ncbi:hypothetical protein CFR75_15670 [Komagataeibacter xylinus]|uniref:Uncharacterized protein n=2 Tax=Komagataeibacter xylinus TaxID=28448 RepID=A0A318PEF9_KOMXY|nr:hypothetical protein CFR75_15670 [Komagataeibacter xylinus]
MRRATFEDFIDATPRKSYGEDKGLRDDIAEYLANSSELENVKTKADLMKLVGNPVSIGMKEDVDDLWESFLYACDVHHAIRGTAE